MEEFSALVHAKLHPKTDSLRQKMPKIDTSSSENGAKLDAVTREQEKKELDGIFKLLETITKEEEAKMNAQLGMQDNKIVNPTPTTEKKDEL